MVVLAVALQPSHGARQLAGILGIDIDENGFFRSPDMLFAPCDTNVPGIFICGYCKRPMDITDAVTDASGASARAAEYISTISGNCVPSLITDSPIPTGGLDNE